MRPSIASSSSAAAAETPMTMNNGTFAGSKPLRMGAAKKRELALVRPLGCCERFFYLYSLAFPVHFCLVARIEGALDSAKIGAALEQVRNRHSALRVCIVDDPEAGSTFCRTDNPIKLHAAPAETAEDWCWAVERELSLPFNTFPGPLMRATALWASDGTSIVLTFHHAIVDALSGTRILHDVMRALAGDISKARGRAGGKSPLRRRSDLRQASRSSLQPEEAAATSGRQVRGESSDCGMEPGRDRSPFAILQGKWNDRAWRSLCSRVIVGNSIRLASGVELGDALG
jgi:uncharacterized membrane protein